MLSHENLSYAWIAALVYSLFAILFLAGFNLFSRIEVVIAVVLAGIIAVVFVQLIGSFLVEEKSNKEFKHDPSKIPAKQKLHVQDHSLFFYELVLFGGTILVLFFTSFVFGLTDPFYFVLAFMGAILAMVLNIYRDII